MRSFFSGAQRNDVFSAVAAEFRNETVLYLRLARELALRSKAESADESSQSSADAAGFFMFFSSYIYSRNFNYSKLISELNMGICIILILI